MDQFTSQIKVWIVCAIVLTAFCCAPEDKFVNPQVVDENPNDTISYKLKIKWQKPLHRDTLDCNSFNPVMMGENVLFSQRHCVEKERLIALRKIDGSLVWEWDEHEKGTSNFIAHHDEIVIYDSSTELFGIDGGAGIIKWKYDTAPLASLPFMSSQDNIWYKELNPQGLENEFSYLIEGNFNEGSYRTIYKRELVDGFIANLQPPALWVAPNSDSVLVFQNRSFKFSTPVEHKVTLIVYNLTKDSTLFEIDDLTESGNSNVRPPVIWDEKIYFAGAQNMYCIDINTGEILWKKYLYQLLLCNWLIEEGKLIVNPDDRTLLALDPYTGDEIWKRTDSGANCSDMKYHDGIIYFDCLGTGRLYAVDISTGEHIWAEKSPNGESINNGVAIDPENNVLYASDGYFALCIELPKK